MDGGSSGGGNVTGTQTQMTDLPEWARSYAKSALEKTQALTDKPYEAYDQNRIAGFSPLQTQAQQEAQTMTTSPLMGQAASSLGSIASRAQNMAYNPAQFQSDQFGSAQAQQYMDPYMQNVVDIQKRKAGEFAGMQAAEQQAKAVQGGAFGGARATLVGMKQAQNTGQLMNDIQAQGSQAAYQQAQQQFNADQARKMQAQQSTEQSRQFGGSLGLQGLQTGLTAASQMGNLGYQTTQQGMDINRLRSAYGGQQQALRQQGLSQDYADWQNRQQYPYKQVGFLSDMIRGLPVGSQSTSITQSPGASAASQLGGLGAVGMGLSKYFAKGGAVKPAGLTALALARMRR